MTKLLAKDGEGERLDRFELIAEIASGGRAIPSGQGCPRFFVGIRPYTAIALC